MRNASHPFVPTVSIGAFADVWLHQVLDLHVVLHCSFVSFKENRIQKGYEITSEYFYQVGDAGHGHSSRCVDRMRKIEGSDL